MRPEPTPPDIAFLAEGAVVLTATRRLAAHLRARFDAAQRAGGRGAWAGADALPLDAWVERAWAAAWPEETLLGAHQEQAAWEAVVRRDRRGTDLIDPALLVRRAAEANRLCAEWDVALGPDAPFLSRESRVFLDWRAAFEADCRARGWVDRGTAVERLIGWIAHGAVAPPARVWTAGFDRVPPQVERLLAAMAERGSEVAPWAPPRPETVRARRVTTADPADEARRVARWARHLLERGETGPIGVVCPHLEEVRWLLGRALRDQLAPGAVRGGEGPPVNFSLGAPLARSPSVATALALLAVGEGPSDTAALCALLRAPALDGAGPERGARARLAARLAAGLGREATLARVRGALEASEGAGSPRLARVLDGWTGALARQRGRRRPSAWARAFAGQLAALGWPGERLDSAAWQAVDAWHEVLGALSGLDAVTGPMDRAEAVRRLSHLAQGTTHQPEGPETAVQVMGTLEAAGLSFTHLWVMGMADTVWPPPPAPNPFIPFALQRDHALPGANAEVQLAHARRITDRLLAAAPDVVVSHAERVEDRVLAVSPLVAHLEAADDGADGAPALAPDLRYVHALHAARPVLETLEDAQGPPLAPGEAAAGGVQVFADQAACPFRAFARRRLGASPVEEPHGGLDARERGTTAHHMMAAVWRDLGDHAALAALSDTALLARLAPLAEGVVARFFAQRPPAPALARLEAERLTRMAAEWLANERDRAPFAVVAAEHDLAAEVGGVPVALRVDRMDRLEAGGLVLIDYKTGRTAPAEWFGERPTAPQLPLYAVTLEEVPVAVAYARLKRGDMAFDGVWEADGPLPGRPLPEAKREGGDGTRAGMLAGWRRVLAALGADFRAGNAAVDPKDDDACRYCDMPPLCRIDERRGETRDDAGE